MTVLPWRMRTVLLLAVTVALTSCATWRPAPPGAEARTLWSAQPGGGWCGAVLTAPHCALPDVPDVRVGDDVWVAWWGWTQVVAVVGDRVAVAGAFPKVAHPGHSGRGVFTTAGDLVGVLDTYAPAAGVGWVLRCAQGARWPADVQ